MGSLRLPRDSANSLSGRQRASEEIGTHSSQVLIIGAGMTGLTAARRLAEQGIGTVSYGTIETLSIDTQDNFNTVVDIPSTAAGTRNSHGVILN